MKGLVVIAIILTSLVASVLLHSYKINHTSDDLDRMVKAMNKVRPLISNGSKLSFMTEPGDHGVFTQARYAIAPAYLYPPSASRMDTLMGIQYLQYGDSNLSRFIGNRHMLWQHTDDRYRYTLTISR